MQDKHIAEFAHTAKRVADNMKSARNIYEFNLQHGNSHDTAIFNAMYHTGLSRKVVENCIKKPTGDTPF